MDTETRQTIATSSGKTRTMDSTVLFFAVLCFEFIAVFLSAIRASTVDICPIILPQKTPCITARRLKRFCSFVLHPYVYSKNCRKNIVFQSVHHVNAYGTRPNQTSVTRKVLYRRHLCCSKKTIRSSRSPWQAGPPAVHKDNRPRWQSGYHSMHLMQNLICNRPNDMHDRGLWYSLARTRSPVQIRSSAP